MNNLEILEGTILEVFEENFDITSEEWKDKITDGIGEDK